MTPEEQSAYLRVIDEEDVNAISEAVYDALSPFHRNVDSFMIIQALTEFVTAAILLYPTMAERKIVGDRVIKEIKAAMREAT